VRAVSRSSESEPSNHRTRLDFEFYAIPIASSFIAGDALVAVILPILYVTGVWGLP